MVLNSSNLPVVAFDNDGAAVYRDITVKNWDGSSWGTLGANGFTGSRKTGINMTIQGTTLYVTASNFSDAMISVWMKGSSTPWEQTTAVFNKMNADKLFKTGLLVDGSYNIYVSFVNTSNNLQVWYGSGTSWSQQGGDLAVTAGANASTFANNATNFNQLLYGTAKYSYYTLGAWGSPTTLFANTYPDSYTMVLDGTNLFAAMNYHTSGKIYKSNTVQGTLWSQYGAEFFAGQMKGASLALSGSYLYMSAGNAVGDLYVKKIEK